MNGSEDVVVVAAHHLLLQLLLLLFLPLTPQIKTKPLGRTGIPHVPATSPHDNATPPSANFHPDAPLPLLVFYFYTPKNGIKSEGLHLGFVAGVCGLRSPS